MSRNALKESAGAAAGPADDAIRQLRTGVVAGNEGTVNNDDRTTLSRADVTAAVQAHFARSGEPDGVAVAGPVRSGHYSVIYRAHVPSKPAIAIKCCVDPASDRVDTDSAVSQFSALERVYRAMNGDPHFRAPKPFFLLREHGIIAMEWITGDSVTSHLLSLRAGRSEVAQLMVRSAQWLRLFHAGGREADRILDIDEKVSGLASLEHSVLREQKTARAGLAALRAHAGTAASRPLAQSWQHGDFKTDNLLVSADDIVGIDAHVRNANATVYDAASFVNHLELTTYHPRAIRLLGIRKRLATIFLEAFDPSYLGVNRPAFLWTALYLMLWNWHEFSRRDVDSLRNRYLRLAFRKSVQRLTIALADAAHPAAAMR